MDKIKREKSILQQLAQSREAVRRKYSLLKHSHQAVERGLQEVFKPITSPLDKIATFVEKSQSHPKLKMKHVNDHVEVADSIAPSVSNDNVSETDYESADNTIEAAGNRTIIDLSDNLQSYLSLLSKNDAKNLDTITGVRNQDGNFMLGSAQVTFDDSNIIIQGLKFKKSDGLWELIFEKNPSGDAYDRDDLMKYRSILDLTNAHRRQYRADEPIRATRSRKYQNIILPLYEKIGSGMKSKRKLPKYKVANLKKSIDYEFWDDPNELVDRLRLLIAEKNAGNTAHTNSIHSIIQELREAGYIY